MKKKKRLIAAAVTAALLCACGDNKQEEDMAEENIIPTAGAEMSEEEKNVAILAFKSGICPILVATSLIEVGIDVKEAKTF